MQLDNLLKRLIVPSGKKISLENDFHPSYAPGKLDKQSAAKLLQEGIQRLAEYQDKLYAQNSWGVLIIFQALDAAGKDSAIKHVMSGVNPQGCQVYSFKAPSSEELDHDFLWRCAKRLPERGRIGIFNRSYYEEVLVVRVHPELLANQKLPPQCVDDDLWERRFDQINCFEKYLVENGVVVIKFFLNVSKEEQKKRFLERIDRPEKNWKFSVADVKEREHWEDYMGAYEDALRHTSSKWAPWYVIPADHKWFSRLAVASVICSKMEELKLGYPTITREQRRQLQEIRRLLERERD